MKNTVVVFGKGNVGKSTLIGYLYARTLCVEDYKKLVSSTKITFGAKYEDIERYAYIVSNKDESKNYVSGNVGNTKSVHFHAYGDFILIDTPGNEHAKAQKDLGMFLGDIGIYVIDAQKLLEKVNFREFSQLFLWNTLKGSENLIIVLSKIDLLNEQQIEFAYKNAQRIFNKEFKLNVPIIPIMIDRENSSFKDKNVIEYYKFDFCEQYVLKEILDNMLYTNEKKIITQNFCIYAERYFDHSHKNGAGVGRTWRNRVLSGVVKSGSRVKILPIKYNRSYTEATAKIKTIKSIEGIIFSFANEGDIIGLDFTDIRIDGRHVDKDDIVSTRGTIIVDENTNVDEGNIFVLKIPFKENTQQPININLLEEVYMYWFGKRVPIILIKMKIENGICTLIFMRQDAYMVMPIIDKKYLYSIITLESIRATDERKKYFNAELEIVGYASAILIKSNNSENAETIKSHIEHHITNKSCTIMCKEDKNVIINLNHNINSLYKVLDDLYCAIDNEGLNVSVDFIISETYY